ncbi:MAG: hypothetical protein HY765_04790 [Rhodomicrobium sp.]|nr:hypothetical protein [Rhodomicrobium sp.]
MRFIALPPALLLLTAAPLGLLGCSSANPHTAGSSPPAKVEAAGITTAISAVTLGPIFGPPKETSDRMVRMLDAAATRAKLSLLNYSGAEGDYSLRGDLSATRLKGKIRVIYNWYVLNRQGEEVGRKLGIEMADAVDGAGGVWSEIPEAKLEAVAGQGVAAVLSRN